MFIIEFKPTNYSSDLTDSQWEQIAEYFPQGPNSDHHKRSLINAVLYLLNNGTKWRELPHDYPNWSTVHTFYYRARKSGLWERVQKVIVEKCREKAGRNQSPSYSIIDSQSVKTTYNSEERGIDGGKKIKGRKRHIAVDILGFILAVVVHAANIHDTKAGCLPASEAFDKYPTIEKFCGDAGYRGTFVEWVEYEFVSVGVDISERIKPEFEILPKSLFSIYT